MPVVARQSVCSGFRGGDVARRCSDAVGGAAGRPRGPAVSSGADLRAHVLGDHLHDGHRRHREEGPDDAEGWLTPPSISPPSAWSPRLNGAPAIHCCSESRPAEAWSTRSFPWDRTRPAADHRSRAVRADIWVMGQLWSVLLPLLFGLLRSTALWPPRNGSSDGTCPHAGRAHRGRGPVGGLQRTDRRTRPAGPARQGDDAGLQEPAGPPFSTGVAGVAVPDRP